MHFYHLKFLEQVLDVKQIQNQILMEHSKEGSNGDLVKDEFEEEGEEMQEQEGFEDLNEDLDSEGMLTGLDAYNSYQIRSDDGECDDEENLGDSPDWNQEQEDPDEGNNQYDYNQYIQQQQRQLMAQKRQNYRMPQQDDDITHFFKSILPFLKMMEPAKKLKIRLDIQELILNEMTRMNTKNTKRKKTDDYDRINGNLMCEKQGKIKL